jgi:hypothetical protein
MITAIFLRLSHAVVVPPENVVLVPRTFCVHTAHVGA